MQKLRQTMLNFEEQYLDSLLGDLKEALAEWSFEGKELSSKKSKIEIIIGVNGVNLFNDQEFRYRFFSSMEDNRAFKHICEIAFPGYDYSSLSQLEISSKLKQIEFSDREPYRYLIHDYFGMSEYKFAQKIQESACDELERVGNKFYELYDYQYMIKQQAINDLSNPDKDLYKILLHMPTGTGKTKTTMHIIAHYINFISKGKGLVVWIAHTNELLRQAYDTFTNVWSHLGGEGINVYKGWVEFPSVIKDGILFTSIQTLQQKLNKPVYDELCSKSSLIIFDEVHKAGANKTKKCIDKLMARNNEYGKKFIGLTATPGRTTDISKENLIFADGFDNIIGIDVDKINAISLSSSEARNYQGSKEPITYFQDNGYLSRINKEMLDYSIDSATKAALMSESSKKEYSPELIEKIAINKSRNMKIVERLKRLNEENKPTIVFACSLQHAKMLSAYLRLIDIQNSLVYGDMDPYDRNKAIQDFKSGNVNIIINYEILTTGFDSTNIKCVFITRPTKSVILYSQMIGRGLRGPKMGGNKECLLIDVEENLIAYDETNAFRHFDVYWKKGE